MLEGVRGYVAMEYVRAHHDISAIFSDTPNTVRLQVTRPPGERPEITSAFIRFGSVASGVRESPTVGGFVARVDIETGRIGDTFSLHAGRRVLVQSHPDSTRSFHIALPHWEVVKKTILEMSEYIPQVEFAGYDAVITETSFKILEINSLSTPGWFQYFYPPFDSSVSAKYFGSKLGWMS